MGDMTHSSAVEVRRSMQVMCHARTQSTRDISMTGHRSVVTSTADAFVAHAIRKRPRPLEAAALSSEGLQRRVAATCCVA
jgi:hypothetical protein